MTDQNKQNETLQSKATTFYSMLSQKFELLEKLPQKQLPMKYAFLLVGIIIFVFAWKQIAVGKIESDMNKELESERTLITQQAREHADKQYKKEEERFGQVLAWAVRSELIRNNIDQIGLYMNEIVKQINADRIVLIGEGGELLVSTDKRLEDVKGSDLYSSEVINEHKITIKSDVDGKKLLIAPISDFNKRIAVLVISYNQAKIN
ncbi:hypothetical protein [Nitrosomonas aestuarii]|uniref:Uncharacterized protein n=1 Tax=Nitrosomonas aestuarii TaxID=52441 RepID=A0A1I4AUC9_9PROT|nr:hypothetical protein [Nitrosomonas aestuarii]PTN11447.1 hypothetical protein C8R11_110118 [Nitrosomonas aestuarii]SFK59547.1 hypothetical protein SAMN05216302_101021 [Nitrosomonas aestuarii]